MKAIRWLGLLPFVMLVLAIPFVNSVFPVIWGLPFLLFWIVLWVALTPIIMLLIYYYEHKKSVREE